MQASPLRSAALLIIAACLTGCERRQPAQTTDDHARSSEPAARPVADARPAPAEAGGREQAARWSAAEAAEHLTDTDPRVAIRAALRLLSIRDVRPACIPGSLEEATAARLRLEPLGSRLVALGLRRRSAHVLRCPVLLTRDGDVLDPVAEDEQADTVLYISDMPDAFPHLLISRTHVWVVGFDRPLVRALAGRKLRGARFALRFQGETPYVALVWRAATQAGAPSQPAGDGPPAAGAREVARYVWDPYELSFMGPQRDRLPDPPGGFFVLDVDNSDLLTPVGGDVPEPNDPNQVVTTNPAVKLNIPPDWSPATRPSTAAAEPNEPNEPNEADEPAEAGTTP